MVDGQLIKQVKGSSLQLCSKYPSQEEFRSVQFREVIAWKQPPSKLMIEKEA